MPTWFHRLSIFFIINLVILVSGEGESSRDLPSERQVHQCKLTANQYAFNVLPGTGWDNLMNKQLGQVLNISYKQCQSSNDGSFLIPDDSIITPIKKSMVELSSDMFEHFANFTSLTSKSINSDVNFATPNYQISGSFSWEKKDLKNNQIKEKSSVSRVQLRHELYSISFQPDSILDSKFRDRILDIGALVKNGKDTIYPQYLADLIIRDFGTHVIRSVDAGSILSKTDVLKSSYVKKFKGDTTSISAAASFSMTKILGITIKGNYFSNTENLNEFNNNSASTKVETIGGVPFGSNFKLEDWEKSLEHNLVAIDRRGDPLFYAITPRSVPELDEKTVYKVEKLIKDAVNRYYAANTRVGCMNMESENFNDDANVDSGTCQIPKKSYNFGGIYQTCTGSAKQCAEITEINPVTGGHSCPLTYDQIKLQDGLYKCDMDCQRTSFFHRECKYVCSYYTLYWCSPTNKTPESDGALFGGFYTTTYPHPITNAYNCPQNYLSLKFGITAKICLSLDKVHAISDNLPFGGFYSCNIGNPLSHNINHNKVLDRNYWSSSCSDGYSSHVAVVDRLCQISYCVKNNVLSEREQPPLSRPPFTDLGFGPNETVVTSLETPNGYQLLLRENGKWDENNSSKSFNYNLMLISITSAAVASMALVIIILGIKRFNRKQKSKIMPEYHEFDENQSTTSTNHQTTFSKTNPVRIIIEEKPLSFT